MNIKKILLTLLFVSSSAFAAHFDEQGQCTGVLENQDQIRVVIYSDYNPCDDRTVFNSLLDITTTYADSSPAGMNQHDLVTGEHLFDEKNNTTLYTAMDGNRQSAVLTIHHGDGDDTLMLRFYSDEKTETIKLKCLMPQICYGRCKK